MSGMRIGIIGGGGWLGTAVCEAIVNAGVIAPHDISLSYRTTKPSRFPDAYWTTDNQQLADRSDVIILSVRPVDWPTVTVGVADQLLISVMAGIRLGAISDRHGTRRVVRAMPNAAAEVGKSYTPWFASAGIDENDRAIVRAIFEACGAQDEVGSERDVDYLTGLSGSGPAFPVLLAAAMVDHAIAFGLSRAVAEKAANTVLIGAGRLMERHPQAPRQTVEQFVEYRGTTAAGIEAMRGAGFDSSVAAGLQSAFDKSVRMGSAETSGGEPA